MSSIDDFEAWRRKRNAALRNLDMSYARTILAPASSDEVRLAGMHKARVMCTDMTDDERETSRQWLRANGYGVPDA